MERIAKYLRIEDKTISKAVTFVIALVFLFSSLSIITRHPMTWYDEGTHLTRVINIVNFDYMVVNNNDWSQIGGDISISQDQFINRATFEIKDRIDSSWIREYSDLSYTNQEVFRATTNTIINNPIVYLPYIIIGFFTKLIHCRPVVEYLLMRIAGFLFFFAGYVYSVRKTPVGKLTFSLVGMAPPVFLSFSSISADNYLIVISLIYLAVLFNLYNDAIINKASKDSLYYEFYLASVLLVLAKIPAFLLIAMIVPYFFYSLKNKKNVKIDKIIGLALIVCICAIITIGWVYGLRHVNTGAFWGRNVDTKKQLIFILSDIQSFVILWIRSILKYPFFSLQIGYSDSSKYASLPFVSTMFFFVSLMLSIGIKDKSEKGIIQRDRIIGAGYNAMAFLVTIMYIGFVFLALYLQFSEVGSSAIDGVQARYFIPLWMLIFANFNYTMRISENRCFIILIMSLFPSIVYHIGVILQL